MGWLVKFLLAVFLLFIVLDVILLIRLRGPRPDQTALLQNIINPTVAIPTVSVDGKTLIYNDLSRHLSFSYSQRQKVTVKTYQIPNINELYKSPVATLPGVLEKLKANEGKWKQNNTYVLNIRYNASSVNQYSYLKDVETTLQILSTNEEFDLLKKHRSTPVSDSSHLILSQKEIDGLNVFPVVLVYAFDQNNIIDKNKPCIEGYLLERGNNKILVSITSSVSSAFIKEDLLVILKTLR